ncbi:hypothetical protein JOC54_002853 [Alkalihalobacillus xiaoxiensis]|uniref:Uncharacterized protein n=1 Tax=Shouchella xiaoxiensis TaxID=766895 RepID=A0ABS2SVK9_9BACI|nr:hypothetical protein [Shouchella xiaoxiensis]MBM7839573.1 hypothetical protein [Shouchella xiaoxiensis]
MRFPTGYANGRVASDYPENLKKYLKIHQLDFVGPLEDSSILVKWGSPGNRYSLTKKIEAIDDKILGIIVAKKTGNNSVDATTLQNVSHLEKNGLLFWGYSRGRLLCK